MELHSENQALVSAPWLVERLGDPTLRIIHLLYEHDVDDYAQAHLPGALRWYWKDLLWQPVIREFADPTLVAERLGASGVRPTDTLVLYSGRAQYAMYGYWVLHTLNGHPDVRVLDGGLRHWTLSGYPTTTERPVVDPVPYPPQRLVREDATRVRRDDVLAGLGKPGRVLLDARHPDEYRGLRVKPAPGIDHGAEAYGHIPGAVNLHARDLLDPDDYRVRPRAELEALFRAAGAAPDQADEVITYCRLGHRASGLWFAATQLLGWRHVRIYDGAWTEWGSSVGLPVEREPGLRTPR
ncbi:MAG TPA: sulfurtransferase [Candidatus Limnocylindrales bacterium]|nr:sulfurtransferase [Candidatus Limnocylindrales bacterium]